MHAGGFVLGNAEMNVGYCKKLASDAGCVVVSVDFRLAPETPFPGPVEDCYSALLWMFQEHQSLGLDPTRLKITWESGGGGLAASLAFLIRDRKEVAIALQFLTYPMLDDSHGLDDRSWTLCWRVRMDKGSKSVRVDLCPGSACGLRAVERQFRLPSPEWCTSLTCSNRIADSRELPPSAAFRTHGSLGPARKSLILRRAGKLNGHVCGPLA